MKQHSPRNHETAVTTFPVIEIPPTIRATSEEIERRKTVVERILRRRKRIGPIGIRADERLYKAEGSEQH